MNDIDFLATVKSTSELSQNEQFLLMHRKYYLNKRKSSNRRYQKRRKLKIAVAKFINELQRRRDNTIDRRTMSNINVDLRGYDKLKRLRMQPPIVSVF